jgi:hypothetical protein
MYRYGMYSVRCMPILPCFFFHLYPGRFNLSPGGDGGFSFLLPFFFPSSPPGAGLVCSESGSQRRGKSNWKTGINNSIVAVKCSCSPL